jgi:GNAT superfamily N-acetyltransferase
VLAATHIPHILQISDEQLGPGFLTAPGVLSLLARSTPVGGSSVGRVATHDTLDGTVVCGYYIAVLPGQWSDASEGVVTTPALWPGGQDLAGSVAYEVAVAVAACYTGLGIGIRLCDAAIGALRDAGCTGIVSHVWMESPSAVALSKRRHGALIRVHRHAWSAYNGSKCARCRTLGCANCVCDGGEFFYAVK